ncbi:Rap1a/Tai family immunity protein [Sulfitobacter sp. 1A15299]|uniref:Rap1a/Tai family immunity protein n=1 Tax=Sulfitobacter sp. 1A15299 TaxID=3368598 RepID=UPI0037476B16
MTKVRIFTLILGLLGSQASSQNVTGNVLYEACDDGQPVAIGYCSGYLVGLWEGLALGATISAKQGSGSINVGACPPPDVTFTQARDIAIRYLQNNPQSRHQDARLLLLDAYRTAFPCS